MLSKTIISCDSELTFCAFPHMRCCFQDTSGGCYVTRNLNKNVFISWLYVCPNHEKYGIAKSHRKNKNRSQNAQKRPILQ